jgi:methionine synthase II (cobalamin-independent)
MEIKVIPYEDKEKYCTEFNTIHSSLSDENIKLHIIQHAASEVENTGQVSQLIEILECIKIEELRNQKVAIQLGKLNYQCF